MVTNYYRIQWQQTTEKIRGLFVMIMIVQLFFGFVSVQSVFREYVSYSIYNGVATIMVTLVTLSFGAVHLAKLERVDVFRLPVSTKWRVDSVMLMLLSLYGSVTALLVPYLTYAVTRHDYATFYDTTLLTSTMLYKNVVICFMMFLTASMFSYTIQLFLAYKQRSWLIMYVVIIGLCAIIYVNVMQQLFTAWQWLGFCSMLLVIEFGFLQWRFKGGSMK